MTVQRIEVWPHAREPSGDFAVVKIFGLDRLEGPIVFRLEPVDDSIPSPSNAPSGWPTGEHIPLGARAVNNTVELLIGPEIVRAPAFEGGTRVRFVMSSAGIDSEFIWPKRTDRRHHPSDGPPPLPAVETSNRQLARLKRRPQPAPVLSNQPVHADHAVAPAAVNRGASPHAALEIAGPTSRTDDGHSSSVTRKLTASIMTPGTPAAAPVESPLAWLIPAGLGVLLMAGLLATFFRTSPFDQNSMSLVARVKAAMHTAPPIHPSEIASAALTDILRAPSISPAGTHAKLLTQRQAFERAGAALQRRASPADLLEAQFWLRKGLSPSLSTSQMIWAVSQLATTYISPTDGTLPDVTTAKVLWRWAAEAGDPDAECFLRKLSEREQGERRNKTTIGDAGRLAKRLSHCQRDQHQRWQVRK